MPLRNGLHDGEPDAAARRGRPRHAIEAIEDAGARLRRNPWTGVGHFEDRARLCRDVATAHRHVHPALPGRVPDRVVDEIADQHTQSARVAAHQGRVRPGQAEVDALAVGERHELGDDFARQIVEPDVLRGLCVGPLLPRQCQ